MMEAKHSIGLVFTQVRPISFQNFAFIHVNVMLITVTIYNAGNFLLEKEQFFIICLLQCPNRIHKANLSSVFTHIYLNVS